MDREECKYWAQVAFNRMAEHRDIWLTHGRPRLGKERKMVAVIADVIEEVVAQVEDQEEWSGEVTEE